MIMLLMSLLAVIVLGMEQKEPNILNDPQIEASNIKRKRGAGVFNGNVDTNGNLNGNAELVSYRVENESLNEVSTKDNCYQKAEEQKDELEQQQSRSLDDPQRIHPSNLKRKRGVGVLNGNVEHEQEKIPKKNLKHFLQQIFGRKKRKDAQPFEVHFDLKKDLLYIVLQYTGKSLFDLMSSNKRLYGLIKPMVDNLLYFDAMQMKYLFEHALFIRKNMLDYVFFPFTTNYAGIKYSFSNVTDQDPAFLKMRWVPLDSLCSDVYFTKHYEYQLTFCTKNGENNFNHNRVPMIPYYLIYTASNDTKYHFRLSNISFGRFSFYSMTPASVEIFLRLDRTKSYNGNQEQNCYTVDDDVNYRIKNRSLNPFARSKEIQRKNLKVISLYVSMEKFVDAIAKHHEYMLY